MQLPKEPSDGQILPQTQLSDSSQLSILPFLSSPYPEIRSAALALLSSQVQWDSFIAERIPPFLGDPVPALRLQAAIALLAHPPLADSLLAQIQPVLQAAVEPRQSLLATVQEQIQMPIVNPVISLNPESPSIDIPDTSNVQDTFTTLPDSLPVLSPDSSGTDSLIVSELPAQPTMVFIQGGSFQMGSEEGFSWEKPVHEVTVSDFYLAETEVTNAQFAIFLNQQGNKEEGGTTWYDPDGPGFNNYAQAAIQQNDEGIWVVQPGRETLPVNYVSWYGARAYCTWLGPGYRLPTDAEWEYAAGGGATNRTIYAGTNSETELRKYGNYIATGDIDKFEGLAPVKQFRSNANGLGLYDMSGNVWEWCQDWFATYPSTPQTNPQGPESGSRRVLRGGGWVDDATSLRVSNRYSSDPSYRSNYGGFRPARNP